jgi:DNA-binding NarL/FixJ family response regulator
MDCAMKHARVLLADRHLGVLESVHELLSALFEAVVMVADERSLKEVVTVFKPDLAVVDLSLAGDGGVNIAGRLMADHPDLRLIVLSVHDEPTVVGPVMGAGVAGFVLKRAAATDLLPAVRATLAGGTFLSPALHEVRPSEKPVPGP